MKKTLASLAGGLAVVVLSLGSFGSFGLVAQAEDNDRKNNEGRLEANINLRMGGDDHKKEAHKLGTTLEVHISDNGMAIVRGAKVTGVSGNTINASTVWGSFSIPWVINTDGKTKFVRKSGGASSVSEVSVGDMLSFQGMVVSTASQLTVQASLVKDWSIQKQAAPVKTTFEGTLKAVSGTIAPTTLIVTIGNTDYTVNLAADTSVLNSLWMRTTLANLRVGDSIRVFGSLSGTTINATVIRDVSIKI